jgi:hypothetical protein
MLAISAARADAGQAGRRCRHRAGSPPTRHRRGWRTGAARCRKSSTPAQAFDVLQIHPWVRVNSLEGVIELSAFLVASHGKRNGCWNGFRCRSGG